MSWRGCRVSGHGGVLCLLLLTLLAAAAASPLVDYTALLPLPGGLLRQGDGNFSALRRSSAELALGVPCAPAANATTGACTNAFAARAAALLLPEPVLLFGARAPPTPMRVRGLAPAAARLRAALLQLNASAPDLFARLGIEAMLCCREVPLPGLARGPLSLHAWGAAVDFTIDGKTDPRACALPCCPWALLCLCARRERNAALPLLRLFACFFSLRRSQALRAWRCGACKFCSRCW